MRGYTDSGLADGNRIKGYRVQDFQSLLGLAFRVEASLMSRARRSTITIVEN